MSWKAASVLLMAKWRRETARSRRERWLEESRPTESWSPVSLTTVPFEGPETTTTLESKSVSPKAASVADFLAMVRGILAADEDVISPTAILPSRRNVV